jgi:cytochrome P450
MSLDSALGYLGRIASDARYYVEPERFNPDRWTDLFSRNLPGYAYFPFGGGPRLCIEKPFTMMEAVIIRG